MWGDNLSRGVLCVDTGQLLIVCVRTVKPVPQRCPCSICMFVHLSVCLSGEAHDTEQSRAMISSDNQQEVLNGFSMNHSWTPPIESYVHHRWLTGRLGAIARFVYSCFSYMLQRTWMSLLTTKFKYERQKLNDIAEVKACRKKFASKRRSAVNDGNDDGDNGTAKRCRRVDVSYAAFTFTSHHVHVNNNNGGIYSWLEWLR